MLDTYVRLLKDHAIKITPQRLEILRYLHEHHTHPTVDEIYSALKTKNPALSKTTVYNSVETLKKHKLIQSLTISGSETRYDLTDRLHHHFLCQCCGAIIDIDITCPTINTIIQNGHRVDEVHGYFIGICRDCLKKGRTTNG